MTGIKDWSTTAASNNAAPPNGAPEATTLVSDMNNITREVMAQTRGFYESPGFRDLGLALEATGGTDELVFTGDQQAFFEVGQKVKYTDAATTLTGTVLTITYSTNTTLTVDTTVTHTVTQVWAGAPIASIGSFPIDNSVIGGTTPVAGTFTTLTATTALVTDTISEEGSGNGVTIDTLPVKDGAMGVGTARAGDVYYGATAGATTKLPSSGKAGLVLRMNAGETAPEWVPNGKLTTTTTTASTTSLGPSIDASTTRIVVMFDLIAGSNFVTIELGAGSFPGTNKITISAVGAITNTVGTIIFDKHDDDFWTYTLNTDLNAGGSQLQTTNQFDVGGTVDSIRLQSATNLTSGRDWHVREYA